MSQPPDHPPDLLRVRPPAHALQNPVASALYGKIQIVADFVPAADHPDQLFIDLFRITVEDTDPPNLLYLAQSLQKLRKPLFPIQIHSIERGFLGNQNQLPDALLRQSPGLFKQLLHGNAPVVSPHLWDNAIRTVLITPFRNFQI